MFGIIRFYRPRICLARRTSRPGLPDHLDADNIVTAAPIRIVRLIADGLRECYSRTDTPNYVPSPFEFDTVPEHILH